MRTISLSKNYITSNNMQKWLSTWSSFAYYEVELLFYKFFCVSNVIYYTATILHANGLLQISEWNMKLCQMTGFIPLT